MNFISSPYENPGAATLQMAALNSEIPLDKLIIVAGHAVYLGKAHCDPACDGAWDLQTFQKGDPPYYIEHIRFGVELAAKRPSSLLVFSGGQTRREAGQKSEAGSYLLLANHYGWWGKTGVASRTVTEEFARDSYENLLFGICRFRECTGRYPASLALVSWAFKRKRFDFHRRAIGWPPEKRRYEYHGINDPDDPEQAMNNENRTMKAFMKDPFGTEEPLQSKRGRRNPYGRKPPYPETCPEIAGLLTHKTVDGMIYTGDLPWCRNARIPG
jgi:hypothetical protein